MNFTISGIIIASLIIISSCYYPATKWQHPSALGDQWIIDKASCQSQAINLSEKELIYKNFTINNERNALVRSFFSQMEVFDAKQRRNYLFEDCLKLRGYKPTRFK